MISWYFSGFLLESYGHAFLELSYSWNKDLLLLLSIMELTYHHHRELSNPIYWYIYFCLYFCYVNITISNCLTNFNPASLLCYHFCSFYQLFFRLTSCFMMKHSLKAFSNFFIIFLFDQWKHCFDSRNFFDLICS